LIQKNVPQTGNEVVALNLITNDIIHYLIRDSGDNNGD